MRWSVTYRVLRRQAGKRENEGIHRYVSMVSLSMLSERHLAWHKKACWGFTSHINAKFDKQAVKGIVTHVMSNPETHLIHFSQSPIEPIVFCQEKFPTLTTILPPTIPTPFSLHRPVTHLLLLHPTLPVDNMFRRLSSSLPQDPSFPADLEKLGYIIKSVSQSSTDHLQVLHQRCRSNSVYQRSRNRVSLFHQ